MRKWFSSFREKERAKLDENIIKEKGNQVYSKIEQQNRKNQKIKMKKICKFNIMKL